MTDFKDRRHIERAKAIRETPSALLVVIDGVKHWIPQSQIDDDSEVYKVGDEGKLVVSSWFAAKEGL